MSPSYSWWYTNKYVSLLNKFYNKDTQGFIHMTFSRFVFAGYGGIRVRNQLDCTLALFAHDVEENYIWSNIHISPEVNKRTHANPVNPNPAWRNTYWCDACMNQNLNEPCNKFPIRVKMQLFVTPTI